MNKKRTNSEELNPYQPPQSIQDIELQMEVIGYPRKKVIVNYAILGALVGGMVAGIFVGLIVIFQTLWTGEGTIYLVFTLFKVVSTMILLAMVGGFIPALITGIVLAWKKIVVSHYHDYVNVGVLGLVVSAGLIFLPLLLGLFLGMVAVRELIICIPVALVGAISAVIVGKWVLPKET